MVFDIVYKGTTSQPVGKGPIYLNENWGHVFPYFDPRWDVILREVTDICLSLSWI